MSELFNESEVRRALAILFEPRAVFEIRALNAQFKGNRDYRGTISGYFKDPDACLSRLSELCRASGIYVTLNPVKPALLSRRANRLDYARNDDTTKDGHIETRRWLLVDVDPERPTGISASAQEKEAAHKKSLEIYIYLEARGWPPPVVADSGNGYHLLYRVDLPASDNDLLKGTLGVLAERFDGGGVKLDRAVHNESRIAKLPGTLAAKGDSTEERPWRFSKILRVPERLEAVTKEQLQGLVDLLAPEQPASPSPASSRKRSFDKGPTKEQVREMLAVIPKRPHYSDWYKVVAAVGDALPDNDAIEVLREWSPEEEPGEYGKKLASGFEDIHVATLIRLAQQHGWRGKIGTPRAKVEAPTSAWGDPQPLPEDLPAVPPFDYQCLPETLRPHIMDIAERMQCPPDFPAVGMMIALGSVLGRKIGIKPKRRDDWLEIANLWGCIIADPGLLKTPALQQALVHLRRLEAKAYEKFKDEMREYTVNTMLGAQRKKLVEDAIKKNLKGNKDDEARKAAGDYLDAEQEKPVCRRYKFNDSTIPKLGELLAENPNGLLLDRDELSGFLRDLDREDRAGDRAKYLEMWDGKGEFTYDRIGRGTVRIPSNTLAILGGIQPDVHMAYVREAVRGGAGNDGLLQRFQMAVWPDVPGEWRNVDEWSDTEAKNQAFAVFEYLDNLTPEQAGADTSEEIPFLRFTDDAQECFDAWRTGFEKRLRSDVEHPAFKAHLAKYRKLVTALALLIHLAERKTGRVSLSALSKALLWADYLEAHARRIYSAVLRPDTAAARELAKHLQRGDLLERFRLREVYRKGWTGLSDKEDAEAAAEILCDLGWIRLAAPAPDRVPGTPGRAASQMFEVNPKILRHPSIPADKTDTINSGGSVSGYPGVTEKSSTSIAGDEKGVARL